MKTPQSLSVTITYVGGKSETKTVAISEYTAWLVNLVKDGGIVLSVVAA